MTKAIKDVILEQFTSSLTVWMIALSLVVAFVISLFIVYVYRKTYSGVVYNKNTSLTMILLTIVTSMIIRTINSNLSLSLGMVGALSIVRFRTAIKEPLDTAYMFWAIAAGIMSGTGQYVIAILGSLILGVLFYIAYAINIKAKSQYLLVINYNLISEDTVVEKLQEIKNKKLKNKAINNKDVIEITYEVVLENEDIINEIKKLHGVSNVNLISYKNDIGA